MPRRTPIAELPPFDAESGLLNAVVETVQGSRNKFTFDETRGLYYLSGVLPAGASFPYEFGFVPSTLGGDGDPLDVLLLTDDRTFPGCLVPARLIGAITAEQVEKDGAVEKNDRLLAVASESHDHAEVRTLADLGDRRLDEIEHFFVSYNEQKGKVFRPTGRVGARAAKTIVERGAASFAKRHARRTRR